MFKFIVARLHSSSTHVNGTPDSHFPFEQRLAASGNTFLLAMFTYMYAFLRDKDSREHTSLSLADRRVWPRRLRFGGMRAHAHGKDPARSFTYINKSLLL
jgi:hypothetical protein